MEERESDVNAYVEIDAKLDAEYLSGAWNKAGEAQERADARDHAIKYGVQGASDPVLAGLLLNLAERDDVITVTHGVIATLVEAAARIDGDTYLAWYADRCGEE